MEGFGRNETTFVRQRVQVLFCAGSCGAVIFKSSLVAVPFQFCALVGDWVFFSDSCSQCIWIVNLPLEAWSASRCKPMYNAACM